MVDTVKGRERVRNRRFRRGAQDLRNGVIRQSENSIEFTKRKRQSRLLGRLTKQLVLDLQVANLKDILADEPFDGSRSILDGKRRAILLVGR